MNFIFSSVLGFSVRFPGFSVNRVTPRNWSSWWVVDGCQGSEFTIHSQPDRVQHVLKANPSTLWKLPRSSQNGFLHLLLAIFWADQKQGWCRNRQICPCLQFFERITTTFKCKTSAKQDWKSHKTARLVHFFGKLFW